MIVLAKGWEGQPSGVLRILNKQEGRLNEDDMDIWSSFSSVGPTIEQTRAMSPYGK